MTIKDIYDKFILEYKLECKKRGIKDIVFNMPTVALWISEAQQDIQSTLKIALTYQDLVADADTEYDLNSDYGSVIKVIVNEEELEPNVDYWIYYTTKWVIKFKRGCTSVIWYNPDFGFYSASGSNTQNWGTFDKLGFTGTLKIPDRYLQLVSYFLLSKCFDDYVGRYEMKIREMNFNRGGTKTRLKYHFNGGIC
jgi:hypothetical protein